MLYTEWNRILKQISTLLNKLFNKKVVYSNNREILLLSNKSFQCLSAIILNDVREEEWRKIDQSQIQYKLINPNSILPTVTNPLYLFEN